MSLPLYAVARLTRLYAVRFRLDHAHHTACPVNAFPTEAKHSSANGEWILAQIEPFHERHRLGEIPGLMLRLMGAPFRGAEVYAISETADPDLHERSLCPKPLKCASRNSSSKAMSVVGRSARSRTSSA